MDIEGEEVSFDSKAFDVITADVPGWKMANNDNISVALDLTISKELKNEGVARDLVNKFKILERKHYWKSLIL